MVCLLIFTITKPHSVYAETAKAEISLSRRGDGCTTSIWSPIFFLLSDVGTADLCRNYLFIFGYTDGPN